MHDKTYIEKDGTASVFRELWLTTSPLGMDVFKFHTFGDEGASPVRYPEEIDFEYSFKSGDENLRCEVVELTASPRNPQWLLISDTTIPANTEVVLSYSFRWKRYAGDLVAKGQARFAHEYRTYSPDDTYIIEHDIYVAKALGEIDISILDPANAALRKNTISTHNIIQVRVAGLSGTSKLSFSLLKSAQFRSDAASA